MQLVFNDCELWMDGFFLDIVYAVNSTVFSLFPTFIQVWFLEEITNQFVVVYR
jgi:hypothetical protein